MKEWQAILDAFKSTMDWFTEKTPETKLSIVIAIIMLFLIYKYIVNENEKYEATQKQISNLIVQVEDCSFVLEENSKLKTELVQSRVNTIMLKASTDYFPFPFWIKDKEGKMMYLNTAYERKYLTPKGLTSVDYIGFDDTKVWGPILGKKFKANDSVVLANNRPMTFNELDGRSFTKFTIELGDYIIGIGGVEYVNYKYID